MFIVLLKFSNNKARAGELMKDHNAWLKKGFDDGVFLLAGGLQPSLGGGIFAHKATRTEQDARVNSDPFVAEGVVNAEIIEITPAKAEERLQFLCQ